MPPRECRQKGIWRYKVEGIFHDKRVGGDIHNRCFTSFPPAWNSDVGGFHMNVCYQMQPKGVGRGVQMVMGSPVNQCV